MPFKPNYRLQRADRKRAQDEKQQKKLERRAERAAQRKAEDEPAAIAVAHPPEQAEEEDTTEMKR